MSKGARVSSAIPNCQPVRSCPCSGFLVQSRRVRRLKPLLIKRGFLLVMDMGEAAGHQGLPAVGTPGQGRSCSAVPWASRTLPGCEFAGTTVEPRPARAPDRGSSGKSMPEGRIVAPRLEYSEEEQQNDDWDRDAEQPEQTTLQHRNPPFLMMSLQRVASRMVLPTTWRYLIGPQWVVRVGC